MPLVRGGMPTPVNIREIASDPNAVPNRSMLYARQLAGRDAVLLSLDGGGGRQILSRYADITGDNVYSGGNLIGVKLIEQWIHGAGYELTWDLIWSSLDAGEELAVQIVFPQFGGVVQHGGLLETVRSGGTTTVFQDSSLTWPRIIRLVGGTDPTSGVLVGVARILLPPPSSTGYYPLAHIQSDSIGCVETGSLHSTIRFWMRSRGHFSFPSFNPGDPEVQFYFSVNGSVSFNLRGMKIRRLW